MAGWVQWPAAPFGGLDDPNRWDDSDYSPDFGFEDNPGGMPVLDDLTGKVALVTGASRGIGKAVAIALAKAGADVAINYRSHRSEADDTCAEIQQLGRRSVAVKADVSVAAEVGRLAVSVEAKLGPVIILVNNAGITRPQPISEIAEQDWDEIIAVNLKSVFLVTQAVLPKMRAARWGRIVNLSSVAAQTGGVVGPHYAASKAGILGLTHFYANLLAKEGITVNAIAPALIETAMVTGNPNARPDLIPVGRFGTVDEVADAAVMLTRNGYVTGQTINVNGGWFMS
jgi:3-oxoacyl-[acyl-carrier protein] reductase